MVAAATPWPTTVKKPISSQAVRISRATWSRSAVLPEKEGARSITGTLSTLMLASTALRRSSRLLLCDLDRLLDDAVAVLPGDEIDVEAIGLPLGIEAIASHEALIVGCRHRLAQLLGIRCPGPLDGVGDDVHRVVAGGGELGGRLLERR